MRLIDIVTPELLERAIHRPKPDDPEENKRMVANLEADQKERLKSTLNLAEVFGKCLLTCGPLVPDVDMQKMLYIQHMTLAAIDAAIELATKETQ